MSEKANILIDIVKRDDRDDGYVVLSMSTEGSKALLNAGILAPCVVTREEAIVACGEKRVKAFEETFPYYRLVKG